MQSCRSARSPNVSGMFRVAGEDNCASLLKTFGLRFLLGENANLEKLGDVFSLIDFLFPEV